MVNDFEVGETVQLKSGGPWMTIDHIGPRVQGGTDNEAICSWFERSKSRNERKTDWFRLTSLKKVDQSQPSGGFVPETSILD